MKTEMKLMKSLTFKAIIYFGLLISFSQNTVFAQTEMHGSNSLPTYPGGIKAIKEFIDANLQYPEIAKKIGISGTVQVSYRINKYGNLEDIKVIRGISQEFDNEAKRVTNLLVGWNPGIRQGKPVDIYVSMPVEFHPENEVQPVVTGRVTDKTTGMPLDGAFVIIKGTKTGTITNANGYYRLEAQGENNWLEFSSIGYGTKVEPIGKNRSINIELDTEYYIIDFNSTEN